MQPSIFVQECISASRASELALIIALLWPTQFLVNLCVFSKMSLLVLNAKASGSALMITNSSGDVSDWFSEGALSYFGTPSKRCIFRANLTRSDRLHLGQAFDAHTNHSS